jgi:hypothetical protein
MPGADDLEAGEKPWINHRLYVTGFTKHFAVLLSQLCERSLATRIKFCSTSEDLDRQSVLKEIWKSNVASLYIEKEVVLVLGSDKFVFDILNEIKLDVEIFESMSAESCQKLTKPRQRERDQSPSSDSMEEKNEEFSVEEIEVSRSLKLVRPDAGGSSSEVYMSSLGLSVPQKIRLPEAPVMYYSDVCTRQAIAFPDKELLHFGIRPKTCILSCWVFHQWGGKGP